MTHSGHLYDIPIGLLVKASYSEVSDHGIVWQDPVWHLIEALLWLRVLYSHNKDMCRYRVYSDLIILSIRTINAIDEHNNNLHVAITSTYTSTNTPTYVSRRLHTPLRMHRGTTYASTYTSLCVHPYITHTSTYTFRHLLTPLRTHAWT